MATMKAVRPFFGGEPTAPDVEKLIKAFGEQPEPGSRYAVDEVARVIGVRVSESRFTTVTNAWRKQLLRNGRQIERPPREGCFVVLREGERSDVVGGRADRHARLVRRDAAMHSLIHAEQLDGDDRRKFDHRQRVLTATAEYLAGARKELAAPLLRAPEALPRK
jgi:hypothetical protein